jgi:uncharacterized hydrophobic protein (TIGR00271 family)
MRLPQLSISPERTQIVVKEIAEGSEPEMRFYIMVAVSTMIASFGLITNSTAVIIGAMLVAPLMTPIFGIALALIRSDAVLFGKALKAEVAGVAAAIAMSLILGLIYPALEPTPEMIARTEPQLFDLLVAVFSGFAGAYALMDEKISPALPGVAIATAIVPPLANVGLCFSVGQYIAGVGSFLLFFANFLSILLISSATFWAFGMAGRFSDLDRNVLIKRFSLPVICFTLVSIFLTYTLINISQNHYLSKAILNTLDNELLEYPFTTLEGTKYNERGGTVYVVAQINSSRAITPTQVSRLQNSLNENIDRPIELIVHNNMARQISALGSDIKLGKQKLDGTLVTKTLHPRVRAAKIADTLIRNILSEVVGFELDHVRVYQVGETPTVVASIYGVAAPHPKTIEEVEAQLKKELGNPEARLVVSFIETRIFDRTGTVRLDFSGLHAPEDDQKNEADKAIALIKSELIERHEIFITGVNYDFIDGTLHVLIDASGPELLSQQEISEIEVKVTDPGDTPIKLFVFMQTDVVITSEGYEPYSSFSKTFSQQRDPVEKEAVQKIIEASNY